MLIRYDSRTAEPLPGAQGMRQVDDPCVGKTPLGHGFLASLPGAAAQRLIFCEPRSKIEPVGSPAPKETIRE